MADYDMMMNKRCVTIKILYSGKTGLLSSIDMEVLTQMVIDSEL